VRGTPVAGPEEFERANQLVLGDAGLRHAPLI
jgi:hypothetical protein